MWHSGPMRLPPALLLTIAMVSPCRADCAPEKMVKVVFRDVTPGIDRGSFEAKPKTLYRLGVKYGRTEEALDSKLKIHGLIVVNEPDLFMVNLVTRTGQHIVDKGEPYHFHAPIVGGPDDPEAIKEMELGCEIDFMKTHGAGTTKQGMLDGRAVDQYEVAIDPYRVVLSVAPRDARPIGLSLYEGEKLRYDMRYLEYANDLEPRPKLFERPEGITFEEAK
jgi:hypothetical protein